MEKLQDKSKNDIFIERRTEKERKINTNVEQMFAPNVSIKGSISEMEPDKITITIESNSSEFVSMEQLLNKHFLISFEIKDKPVVSPAASIGLPENNKNNLVLKLYNIKEDHYETISKFIDDYGYKKES